MFHGVQGCGRVGQKLGDPAKLLGTVGTEPKLHMGSRRYEDRPNRFSGAAGWKALPNVFYVGDHKKLGLVVRRIATRTSSTLMPL